MGKLSKGPSLLGKVTFLKASWLDTKLGPMIAIADENALYLLEFVDRRGLEREVERLRQRTKSSIIPGTTDSRDPWAAGCLAVRSELRLLRHCQIQG